MVALGTTISFVGWQFRSDLRSGYYERAYPTLESGGRDGTSFSESVLRTCIAFLSAAFGRSFGEADTADLLMRLRMLVTEDAAWRPQLTWFARRLDTLSKRKGSSTFVDLNRGDQEAIVRELMLPAFESRLSKAAAFFSETERQWRLMRASTAPRLMRIYRWSGVPWRARDYVSWPGIPGDPRDYTKPGNPRRC